MPATRLPLEFSGAFRCWVLPGTLHLRLWLSVGLLLAWSMTPAATPYVHESWTVRDGLPVNSVNHMIQSKQGYLWLATFDGLVRFDGARFQPHTSSNTRGLEHQRLVGVIEAGDGRLLLSSDVGVLQLFDPITATAQVLWTTPSGKAPLAWLGPDTEIWISLEPGLGRLRGDRIEPIATPPVSQWQISALGFGAGGQLWVGTANAGVWTLMAGAPRQLAASPLLSVGHIYALAEDSHGTLMVGGERGIDLIDANGVRTLRDGDRQWRVATQSLQRNRDGEILVGSEMGPYQMLDGQLLAIDPIDRRRIPAQDQVLASEPAGILNRCITLAASRAIAERCLN